jgi:magnesium chelatase family protein
MAVAHTSSVAVVGVTGHVIAVETDITNGLPATILVGLPDSALREARDRVRAAIVNSGELWPQRRITIGLSPATLPKHGCASDLAVAIGVLTAAGTVPQSAVHGIVFLGELGLDGRLRPVRRVLPAVAAAAKAEFGTVMVAAENAAEAALVPGVRVISAATLTAAADWLRGTPGLHSEEAPAVVFDGSRHCQPDPSTPLLGGSGAAKPDLAEVPGQAPARYALEVCAAGGHHLSLLGPPGAGKTMLAERLPTILPPLDTPAALDVTSIHSVAGTLEPGAPLITAPPFLAPHHTSSKAAIVGGGSGTLLRPGAASLAHRGVLFLDEAPEFSRDTLDALRQPLESGEIILARSGAAARFPARFTLVMAANPCPCAKSAGPTDLLNDRGLAESSTAVAVRVAAARARAERRLAGSPWRLNAEVPGSELRRTWPPAPGALTHVERALERGVISARGVVKVIRVAWTIADLNGTSRPGAAECESALGLWLGVTQ